MSAPAAASLSTLPPAPLPLGGRGLLGRPGPLPVDPADLVPSSPFRRPDWRWQRAVLLRQEKRNARRRYDDEFVAAALRFQKAQAAWQGPYAHIQLAERWPHLYQAWNVERHGNARVRHELQARLLSQQPLEDVAARLSLTVDDVRWYRQIFFQVEDRLKATGYIVHVVFGENFIRMREGDYATLWKFFGYFMGPLVLDTIVNRVNGATRPRDVSGVQTLLSDDLRQVILMQASLAARTLNVNSFNQLQVLEIYQKYLEIEKLANGSASSAQFLASVSALVQGLEPLWKVQGSRDELPATEPRAIPLIIDGMPPPAFPAPAVQEKSS